MRALDAALGIPGRVAVQVQRQSSCRPPFDPPPCPAAQPMRKRNRAETATSHEGDERAPSAMSSLPIPGWVLAQLLVRGSVPPTDALAPANIDFYLGSVMQYVSRLGSSRSGMDCTVAAAVFCFVDSRCARSLSASRQTIDAGQRPSTDIPGDDSGDGVLRWAGFTAAESAHVVDIRL
ncbi:hypothetical protein PYCCODRAFT_1007651 [Trametes coccinea BRFM310]|uniref:Uncharacterized protein n=1 Tax=Trametes coccinea (strain BRFM310) TaxID=1353009 RepID=A0A1Y2IB96_TRAC3|nr:hypothetical protein PYCCODRAFT_1007651 [Trametes coccinea BRFM310]